VAHLLESLLAHAASLGVGHLVGGLLDVGREEGGELEGVCGGVYELGHVENDERGFSADGGGALGQTTEEEGHHEGQSPGIDRLNEGGGSQLVDAILDLVGLGDAANEVGDEGFDVAVADSSGALDERGCGSGGEILLQIAHGFCDRRHDVGEAEGDLRLSGVGEGFEHLEGSHLGLPLDGGLHDIKEVGESDLDGGRVEVGHDGGAGGISSGADGGVLLGKKDREGGGQGEGDGKRKVSKGRTEDVKELF
jgi:hypothetical protein